MIIERLILRNFGVYRGENEIDLTPRDSQSPVILFGGLNGCGKTTLLDAIQLTLYGKQARCSNRGRLAYGEFLRRASSHGLPTGESCGVEMELRTVEDGGDVRYRIARSWDFGKSPKEVLNLWKDGRPDPVLATRWPEHVEELLPVSLSSLFFFDGEKIEKLADLEKSKAIIADALHALLGLDTVDQLSSDLKVLERNKRKESQTEAVRQRCEELEAAIQAKADRARELTALQASRQNDFDQAEKSLAKIEDRFRAQGGEQLENQQRLEFDREVASKEVESIQARLVDLAAGPAPLLMLDNQLRELQHQAEIEHEAEFADRLGIALQKRDAWLVEEMSSLGLSPELKKSVCMTLEADRASRLEHSTTSKVADLERSDHGLLQQLIEVELPEVSATLSATLDCFADASETLAQSDALLASIPEQERVADLIEERRGARETLEQHRIELATVEAERARLAVEAEDLQRKLERLLEAELDQQTASADSKRVIEHSTRARATLNAFRAALIRRHTGRIESLALDSFSQLMRKSSLVKRIEIDPESYEVRLAGKNGDLLPADRLSAGERQLLAVALLWGLARASGRPTPVAIDTPLGRLDSNHRINLVEGYFPHASHQVLLFSTDEEIVDEHLKRLRPSLTRTYLLRHNDDSGQTSIEAGYFH